MSWLRRGAALCLAYTLSSNNAAAEAGEAEIGDALGPLLTHWVLAFLLVVGITIAGCALFAYLCASLWRRVAGHPLSRFWVVLLGIGLTGVSLIFGWPLLIALAIRGSEALWHY